MVLESGALAMEIASSVSIDWLWAHTDEENEKGVVKYPTGNVHIMQSAMATLACNQSCKTTWPGLIILRYLLMFRYQAQLHNCKAG